MMFPSSFTQKQKTQTTPLTIEDCLNDTPQHDVTADFLGHRLNSEFQPIVELRGRLFQTIGFEAFVRPSKQSLPIEPSVYFDRLAPKECAFADQLCHRLHAINFLRQSYDQGVLSLHIASGSLPHQLERFERLFDSLSSLVRLGLSADRLIVELELDPKLDAGVTYTFATYLRKKGFATALSGFDADCACFNRIVQCRPAAVVFNRSWLRYGMKERSFARATKDVVDAVKALRAIPHFAQLETAAEMQFALRSGFQRFQGHYFGQPRPSLVWPQAEFNEIVPQP